MSRLAHLLTVFLGVLAAPLLVAAPASAQAGTYETAAPAAVQEGTYETPAHISFVEGTAVLERDGVADSSPRSMPLLAGDRLRTEAGRVEVLFADGSTLHLDANTVVDFQSDEVVRLLQGRIRLNIPGPDRAIAYRIDAPGAWVEVRTPGEYRVSLLGGERAEVELAVLRGAADLVNDQGATELRAGERAYAAASLAPSQPYVFNSANWDAFDRWSEERRDRRLGVSAQYLPAEVRPYAASLDSYGTWRHVPAYGYVWYPRVAAGWRPYYHGRWKFYRPFGWTWIGHDPWAWPTHHYGRWGFSAGVWFWIPGRHWGPAWVSWAYAPGYVSWCPLGFNNRPVFSFVSVNVFAGRRFTPWHGWTVVPHRRFGRGAVNINVVNVTRIDVRTRERFVVRRSAPAYTGVAVARAAAPIRAAGSRITGVAVPRGSAPGIVSPSAGTRSRQAVGRRSGTGTGLTGPGYPAPARQPRPSAVAPSQRRAGPAVPRSTAPDATASSGSRRAVPRAAPGADNPARTPAPERRVPSRRAVPRGDSGSPPAARGGQSGAASSGSRRAVPRGGGTPAASPSPRRGGPAPRATPRGGSHSGASAGAARSRTAPPAAAPAPRTAVPVRRAAPRGGDAPAAGPRESRSRVLTIPRSSRPAPSREPDRNIPSRVERPSSRTAGPGAAVPSRTRSVPRTIDAPRESAPGAIRRSAPRPEVRSSSPGPAPRAASRGPSPRRAPSAERPVPRSSSPAARPAPSSGAGGGGAVERSRSRPRGGGHQSTSQPRRRRGGNQ